MTRNSSASTREMGRLGGREKASLYTGPYFLPPALFAFAHTSAAAEYASRALLTTSAAGYPRLVASLLVLSYALLV